MLRRIKIYRTAREIFNMFHIDKTRLITFINRNCVEQRCLINIIIRVRFQCYYFRSLLMELRLRLKLKENGLLQKKSIKIMAPLKNIIFL